MEKKITVCIYFDENGGMRLRKNSYKLGDGELCVKLTVTVPKSFYRKRAANGEVNVIIPDDFKQEKINLEAKRV